MEKNNAEQRIRLVICDDMPFIAENFKNILNAYSDIEVVAVASSGVTCIEAVNKFLPDIVLLDIQMDISDEGIITLEKIKNSHPDIKIIMCTIHSEDEFVLRSFVLGANGYFVKTEPTAVLVSTIRDVFQNNLSLNANLAQKILRTSLSTQYEKYNIQKLLDTIATLTITEYEILKLIYKGMSYKSIAYERMVEESTIRSQINKILKKFDYKNMKQLIKYLKSLQIFD